MNAKRLSLALMVLAVLLAVQIRTQAQGAPPITQFDFNPANGTEVGQPVKITITVGSSNPGATHVTPSCGGVSKTETSEVSFDSDWNTNGCSAGVQNVLVCTRSPADEQWYNANCQRKGYNLTGGNPNLPTAKFWADTGNLQPSQCTTMHWQTSGATSVNIDGKNKSLNGDEQICPSVTTKYSLRASGPGGDAYLNFDVVVTNSPQPQQSGPTNATDKRDVPSQPGLPSLAQARQQHTPGGVDVVVYCAAKGYGGPSNAPDNSANAAYSWKCGNVSLGDFTQVCRDVYGDSFHPVNVMGANRLGGWRCVQGGNANPAPAKPQLPTNCSGVLPPRLVIGQKAIVTQEGDGHNLRAGNGLNEPIRGNLRVGDVVVVIGGPRCTDGYQWWQLQTANKGTWWAAEADSSKYWLEQGIQPANQPAVVPVQPSTDNQSNQPVQPPAIPPNPVPPSSGSKNQSANKPNIGCLEVYVDPSKPGVLSVPEAYADEPSCVNYVVDHGYRQVWECIKPQASAYTWADSARSSSQRCGLTVNPPQPGGVADLNKIYSHDLVVWQRGCAGAGEPNGDGHIAILISIQNGMMTLDEGNWSGTHTRPVEPTCMTFIHVNSIGTKPQGGNSAPQKLYPPLDQEGSSWIKAGSVHIGTYRTGETNDNWVEVAIPSPYKRDSFVLHLTYLLGDESLTLTKSVIPTLCVKGYDYYRFILRSDVLGQIESKVWINQHMLQDPSAWYVTFSKQ